MQGFLLIPKELKYEYPSNNWGSYSNKLARVKDDITSVNNEMSDFKPNLSSTQDYGFDANGNLISDPDKRIASISYNHLNLPSR